MGKKKNVLIFIGMLAMALFVSACGDDGVSGLSDAEAVAADRAALEPVYAPDDSASSVTKNITLVSSGSNNTTITWDSDTPATLASDGTVTRPAFGSADAAVTLTATISRGTVSDTKSFALTVRAERLQVTYDGNGNTAGTAPADPSEYDGGSTVTLSSNTGHLEGTILFGSTKKQFLGWSTDPAAAAVQYRAGETFSITSNTTFYAVYTALRVTGPAGGLIFYDKGNNNKGWRYLEAAPNTWSGGTADPLLVWSSPSALVGPGAQGTAMGTGASNTTAVASWLDAASQAGRAAQVVDALVFGGYDDWFIPSKDTLDEMCWILHSRKWTGSAAEDNPAYGTNRVGGFADARYWSSSEFAASVALTRYFDDGNAGGMDKSSTVRVRPIRAF